jgi:metal-responsive CopG/Arc/MetJ family transcriptional regulator
MKRIIIQLDEDALVELDEAAEHDGESRSAVVRAALEDYLSERRRRRDLRRAIESFRRRPQDDDLIAPKRTARASWPD